MCGPSAVRVRGLEAIAARPGMRRALAAGAVLLVFGAVYLPDLGHGFLRDDFRWIRESRVSGLGDLPAFFMTNVGFYRPLVSVSFAADHAIWGLNPLGYGATNVVLLLASALLVAGLARRLALTPGAALLAAAVLVLNAHGVNMALLWTSGRTSLLALLFALGTVHAVLGRRFLLAGLLCLCALLSKEEVVALPLALTLFVWLDGGRWRQTWPLWASLAVYLAMRAASGALTPGTAPEYYRYSFEPLLLLRNAAEYADRAGTLSAAVSLVLVALTPRPRPAFSDGERRALRFAAVWIPAMYAATFALPVRSALYALAPSAGCALVAGVFASRLARTNAYRFERVAAALLVITVILVPIYRMRNERWVEPARFGTRVLDAVQASVRALPAGGHLVLVDDPASNPSFAHAFSSLFPDAAALFAGSAWTGTVVSSLADVPPDAGQVTTVIYQLRNGAIDLVAIRAPAGGP